ncbi:hypothetical protein SODG_007538 [Sodalis praecaptivus]
MNVWWCLVTAASIFGGRTAVCKKRLTHVNMICRMHLLLLAHSRRQKISGISLHAAQLRSDDGAAFVEVAAGHAITINTPGTLKATAQGGVDVTAPTIVLNGNVTINGNLSQGMGDSGEAPALTARSV